MKTLSINGKNKSFICFGFFKFPNLANLASLIRSAYRNKEGTNLIVRAINTAIVLGFILIIFNGINSFSIAVTMLVIVVVKVRIDAIIMNKMNFHIVLIPWSNSFLEKKMYINSINKNMKKNGLKFLNKDEKFIFDKITNRNINNEKIANL